MIEAFPPPKKKSSKNQNNPEPPNGFEGFNLSHVGAVLFVWKITSEGEKAAQLPDRTDARKHRYKEIISGFV